ncbi:thioredoxin-like protein, partial [Tricharina praecox]|uniref:thioredoxin-like protein n=1 Tax=Tricharina praecox TaxID=43433 RepID=UPI002220D111
PPPQPPPPTNQQKAVAAVVPASVAPATEEKPATADEEPAAAAVAPATSAAAAPAAVAELNEGDSIPDDLPEIQTHTGETTTISALVAASEKGIVIFAYPKASTPGCTTQACAFRDSTAQFRGLGYAVYGLSGDSPSANEKFHTKQNLADIQLLCDAKYELHARLGVKKAGAAKGTVRSVVVIQKAVDATQKATVLKRAPANPAQSVDVALKAINAATAAVAATAENKEDEDAEMKD